MRRVEVLRYYGHGKFSNVESAQRKVDKLSEKNPLRDYTILTNMRSSSGYQKFQVVQIDKVVQNWPDPEDLGLPEKEPLVTDFKSYDDYHYESTKRRNIIQNATRDLKAALSRKLNP